ncbi:hypothetical protein OF83DRAFT_1286333 [Amylostereum chailletii]|nr:hypothetical protein OF83DRAFT_1286333 [Amylostereum chailletii]
MLSNYGSAVTPATRSQTTTNLIEVHNRDVASDPSSWATDLGKHLDKAKHILLSDPSHAVLYHKSDLDSALAHVEHVARAIKHYRNESALIHRLPPELLIRIYHILAAIQPAQGPHDIYHHLGGSTIGWIQLGHVCQRWRALVQSTPTLWASSIFTLPTGQERRLALSRNAPLSIDLVPAAFHALSHSFGTEVLPTLVPRAGTIDIHDIAPYFYIWTPLKGALEGGHTPYLTSLSFACGGEKAPRSTWTTTPLHAPRLRSVLFRNAFIPFHSNSLRELEITNEHEGDLPFAPSFFLAVLQVSSPLLERLTLNRSIPDIESISLEIPPITLPRLLKIELEDLTDRCAALARHLVFPPTADVYFQLDNVDEGWIILPEDLQVAHSPPPPDRFSNLVQILHQRVYGTDCARPTVGLALAEYSGNPSRSIQLCLCARRPGAQNRWTGPFGHDFELTTNVQFYRWYPDENVNFATTLASLTTVSAFAHVQILELTVAQQDYEVARWREVLYPLQSIQELFIDDEGGRHAYPNLVSSLGPPPISHPSTPTGSSGEHTPDSQPLFPKMHTLWLYCVHVDGAADDLQTAECIVSVVTYRAKELGLQHVQIDRLYATHSQDAEQYAKRIQDVVSDLVYEIVERDLTEDDDFVVGDLL